MRPCQTAREGSDFSGSFPIRNINVNTFNSQSTAALATANAALLILKQHRNAFSENPYRPCPILNDCTRKDDTDIVVSIQPRVRSVPGEIFTISFQIFYYYSARSNGPDQSRTLKSSEASREFKRWGCL